MVLGYEDIVKTLEDWKSAYLLDVPEEVMEIINNLYLYMTVGELDETN